MAHDHLWNLVPTVTEVNSVKSNNLPASVYFDKFVSLQHRGLVISHRHLSEGKWERFVEPFILDLKFDSKRDLFVLEKLRMAYQLTLLPLLELAKNLGFSTGWKYLQKSSNDSEQMICVPSGAVLDIVIGVQPRRDSTSFMQKSGGHLNVDYPTTAIMPLIKRLVLNP